MRIHVTKEQAANCYIVFLTAIALAASRFFFSMSLNLWYSERMVLWQNSPLWAHSLVVLICLLLAAILTESRYRKYVGLFGVVLMIGAVITQLGSMAWLNSTVSADGVKLVEITGKQVRLPLGLFLAALYLLKGGAGAVIINQLSRLRNTSGAIVQARRYIAIFALSLFGALLSNYLEDISPILTSIIVCVYMIMLVSALFFIVKRKDSREEAQDIDVKAVKRTTWPILSICITCLTFIIMISFRRHFLFYCRQDAFPMQVANFIAAMPFFVLAISILLMKKQRSILPMTGSILILLGIPLAAILKDIFFVDFLPQLLIGLGVAMILSQMIEDVLNVPSRHYALIWAGMAISIGMTVPGLLFCLDRLRLIIKTMSINIYIILPLIAMTLVVMCYFWSKRGQESPE